MNACHIQTVSTFEFNQYLSVRLSCDNEPSLFMLLLYLYTLRRRRPCRSVTTRLIKGVAPPDVNLLQTTRLIA